MLMKKKYIYVILVSVLLVVFDQITKALIISNYNVHEYSVVINNFFNIFYIRNYGAAFGILSQNIIFLIGITCIMIYYVFYEIKRNINNNLSIFSLTLVLGGAVGNLIDRIFRGYVVDFLSFRLFNYDMPVFNVADIFITCGVILVIFCILREGKYEKNSSRRRK